MDAAKTGALIAQARKEKDLTQGQLAQRLHVSVQAVSKWERGRNFPDLALLEPLAEALDLTVSELLAGERGEPPQETAVREALRSLASRNVVTVRQGAGTFISEKNGVADDPLGFAMMEDPEKLTRDLLQIRVMLEPPIAALAAQNRGEEDLERLRALLEEIEGRIARREEYAQLDSQFHAQIAVCSHNAVVSNLIPVITEGVRTFARTVAEPEYVQTLASHRAVYEAIREGRAADAQEEMLYHLLYNKKRYRHG